MEKLRCMSSASAMLPNFDSIMEDVILIASQPLWLTSLSPFGNKARDPEAEGYAHFQKKSDEAEVWREKEPISSCRKMDEKREDGEEKEARKVIYPLWIEEYKQSVGPCKSFDNNDMVLPKMEVIKDRQISGELGVFMAEKYFSETHEEEKKTTEHVKLGSYLSNSGQLLTKLENDDSLAETATANSSAKVGIAKTPPLRRTSSSTKLGSILTHFKLSASPKQSHTKEARLISPKFSRSNAATNSGASSAREPPPLFYNGAHNLPSNGKPSPHFPRPVFSSSFSSSSSSSSIASAPINRQPSSLIQDSYSCPQIRKDGGIAAPQLLKQHVIPEYQCFAPKTAISTKKGDEDSYESDSSSDLFELESLDELVGIELQRRNLPVFRSKT